MLFEQYYDFLCLEFVVIVCAHLWGVAQHIKFDKKTFDNPLRSLWNGVIEGCMYALGASFICAFLPNQLQGIISIVCIVSVLNMKVRELLSILPGCPRILIKIE